jgi:tRNA-2-methylthio-N6-dimethylallyladenosine synthase
MTPKKAYIRTFGCQMNEHDSFRMQALLEASGYAATDSPDDADLILVNTCSVRHNPENKVYSLLGRLRRRKQQEPDIIIGVGGCVAQQEGTAILERERAVDLVFGPDNLFRLPELIERVRAGERVCETGWLPRQRKVQNFIPEEWVERGHVDGVKAYIAITKGCNNLCTFCIVPTTRGREVSREPENLLREARSLVEKGAREIWLLGQNVNSYRASKDYRFFELLDDMSRVEGLERLRFTSPHPKDWNDALSDLMAGRKAICNHLHLPFQAGSDRILALMRRNHRLEDYLAKVRYLQRAVPGVEITTDLIAGFPTETEEDFQRTLDCIEEVRFSQLFAFKYSPRPGTVAADMPDDVPQEVKEERLQRVIEAQERINEAKQRALVGTVQEVLIDGAHPRLRHVMNGRTQGYRPISVRSTDLELGDVALVRVTGYPGHWLEGEPAEAAVTL